ncbi:hypothetical protein INQ25_02125 [Wolbachia endosymbiont of Rhagoletis cerasi]|uniref:hypothetical protein n=1 Tax=Wolbachia endosymbiont of Rhagoletis cerasi TaxID=225363 RepID=UPI001BD4CE93|nr:hypothetical protein [Wolbachia endosymbiont of Rhagoletis cerasi]MBS9530200.1 hypothetical protein [Wolbachia endosymbiont of Rhagoletis cerasi]
MRTPKKIWKDIAEKLRNKKGTTTAKGADMEMPADVEEVKVEIKKQTNTVDKATETDTKLCNINSEDLQPICESSEKAQIETTVEPTSEPCFDSRSGNDVDEKNKQLTQQRQAIIIGSVVGAILLASSAALYIMKMPVVAVVVGIAGLVCLSFALHNVLKPSTKIEKVEDTEQPIVESPLNPT